MKQIQERSPAKRGRPTLFNDIVAKKIIDLIGAGKTDKQIGEIVGITDETIRQWRKKHQQFSWTVNEAKAKADEAVEASLFHRAVGYSHPKTVFFTYLGSVTDQKEVTEYYPPDPTSMIFWLKNRKPQEWRERAVTENNTQVNISQIPASDKAIDHAINLTLRELARLQMKSEKEGLTAEDHRSLTMLSKSLMDMKEAEKRMENEYIEKLSGMPKADLITHAKMLVAKIEEAKPVVDVEK